MQAPNITPSDLLPQFVLPVPTPLSSVKQASWSPNGHTFTRGHSKKHSVCACYVCFGDVYEVMPVCVVVHTCVIYVDT